MSNRRLRNFVFTLNNYTDSEYDILLNNEMFKYIIIGKEVGEEGTPHLQGYAECKDQQTFDQIKLISPRLHIEKRRGSQKQAIRYCKKDGDFVEKGEPKNQGHRTDMEFLKSMILNTEKSWDEILPEIDNYQQLRFAENLMKFRKPKNNFKPKNVYWFFGPTGTGKTKKAFEEIGQNPFWISCDNLKWFDGYVGQTHVIFDDFRKDFCTFHFLLRLLDGYPCKVPIKGGFVDWIPTHIYITSAYPPGKVYETREDVNQLHRRITLTEQFFTNEMLTQ